MIKLFDDWMFDNHVCGFQTLSNRFQRLTGLTCFFLAKWCWIGFVAMFLAAQTLNGALFENMVTTAITIVFLVATPFLVWRLEAEEKELPPNTMNRNRIDSFQSMWRTCVAILVCGPIFLSSILMILVELNPELALHYFAGVLLVSYYYFEACTPLPPQKSSMRKWAEQALTKINEWAAPKPTTA